MLRFRRRGTRTNDVLIDIAGEPLTLSHRAVMNAVNFSVSGVRWRATPITSEDLTREHAPELTSTGVLFTSAEGEVRFLPFDADAVATFEFLKSKQNAELGALVRLAKRITR
jgi:hypothetical protein